MPTRRWRRCREAASLAATSSLSQDREAGRRLCRRRGRRGERCVLGSFELEFTLRSAKLNLNLSLVSQQVWEQVGVDAGGLVGQAEVLLGEEEEDAALVDRTRQHVAQHALRARARRPFELQLLLACR